MDVKPLIDSKGSMINNSKLTFNFTSVPRNHVVPGWLSWLNMDEHIWSSRRIKHFPSKLILFFPETVYGQGAYFATTASYSSRNQYAVLDNFNKRNIFLCKVLTGRYAVGNSDMRTPPEISQGTGQRYHTTVDDDKKPEIFVTYNDVQAYPEYHIVFTDS